MDKHLFLLHIKAQPIFGIQKSCKSKRRYRTEYLAEKMTESHNSSPCKQYELWQYPCIYCCGWHIGRKLTVEILEQILERNEKEDILEK